MIHFITTAGHRYTHASVAAALPFFRQISYPLLFARRRLPRGTYIFSDLDRLSVWQLEIAAHHHRILAEAGCRVLNDPARILLRLALLRRLHKEGINSFQAWPATEADSVDRFPVFLRTAASHRGNLTDLIADGAALTAALQTLVGQGYPLADLIVIEYRAEPMREDIFRKLAVYRIGDRMIPAPSVHERSWTAKLGADGVAGEEGYDEDLARMRTNPHGALIRRVFDLAGLAYGRADFGLVGGRPEIYEINSNPMVKTAKPHTFASRTELLRQSQDDYRAAMAEIDTISEGFVRMPRPEPMKSLPRRLRLFPGYQWTP